MTTDQIAHLTEGIEYAIGSHVDCAPDFNLNLVNILDVREMADGSGDLGIFVHGTGKTGSELDIRVTIDTAGRFSAPTVFSPYARNLSQAW